eukprot:2746672-Pleurochrysis_carterae.AAC.1
MSQHALDSSAVLGFMRNQLHFYRRRYPVSLSLPSAVLTPGEGAYAQFRGAPATGQTMGSSSSQSQQQIDYPRMTAKLRE